MSKRNGLDIRKFEHPNVSAQAEAQAPRATENEDMHVIWAASMCQFRFPKRDDSGWRPCLRTPLQCKYLAETRKASILRIAIIDDGPILRLIHSMSLNELFKNQDEKLEGHIVDILLFWLYSHRCTLVPPFFTKQQT